MSLHGEGFDSIASFRTYIYSLCFTIPVISRLPVYALLTPMSRPFRDHCIVPLATCRYALIASIPNLAAHPRRRPTCSRHYQLELPCPAVMPQPSVSPRLLSASSPPDALVAKNLSYLASCGQRQDVSAEASSA